MNLQEFWKNALAEIELQISHPNFATWLKSSQLVEKNDGVALVSLPNNFAKNWVETKYHKTILKSIRNLSGEIKEVNYTISRMPKAGITGVQEKTKKKRAATTKVSLI